jgi:hypothetical protein
VSCADGHVGIAQRSSDGIQSIGRVATSSGAWTSLFAPELDRLFVAASTGWLKSAAAILRQTLSSRPARELKKITPTSLIAG